MGCGPSQEAATHEVKRPANGSTKAPGTPPKPPAGENGLGTPLVRVTNADGRAVWSSTSTDGAASPPPPPEMTPPSKASSVCPPCGLPCDEFRIDVTAEKFGTCVCGRPQAEHSVAARSKRNSGRSSFGDGWIDPKAEGHPEACADFRLDVKHETFGTCLCGFPRAAHRASAIKGRSNSMRSPKQPSPEKRLSSGFIEDIEYVDPRACGSFELDVLSSRENMCVCGVLQKHHDNKAEAPPSTRRRSRSASGSVVGRLVERHESLIRDAAKDAWMELAEQENLAAEKNARRAAERLKKRREKWLAKIEKARRDGQCEAPSFANVAEDSKTLVIEVKCGTPDALLYWYHAKPGADAARAFEAAADERGSPTAGLRRHDPAKDGPLRVTGTEPGTHVVVARALKKGLIDSDLASGCFRLEPPSYLFTSAHPHELRSLHLAEKDGAAAAAEACSVCATPLARGEGFTCATCDYTLCLRCALPHRHGGDQPGSPGRAAPPPGASVAVDVGARRLWLSDTIRFRGNAAEILEESKPLVGALASALAAHPGIAVRLEGHTNSACGLDCDGSTTCLNPQCAANFGKKGGAVGFSLARARAVRTALVSRDGIDASRVEAIGLAGSRRLEIDTEGPGKARNRRVEVHTLEF